MHICSRIVWRSGSLIAMAATRGRSFAFCNTGAGLTSASTEMSVPPKPRSRLILPTVSHDVSARPRNMASSGQAADRRELADNMTVIPLGGVVLDDEGRRGGDALSVPPRSHDLTNVAM